MEDGAKRERVGIGPKKKLDAAFGYTIRSYADRFGLGSQFDRTEARMRENPLLYLGMATGIGFVIGGGMATQPGTALLALLGRRIFSETATNLVFQTMILHQRD